MRETTRNHSMTKAEPNVYVCELHRSDAGVIDHVTPWEVMSPELANGITKGRGLSSVFTKEEVPPGASALIVMSDLEQLRYYILPR